jgi:AmmeMemoRadiSam system protein A
MKREAAPALIPPEERRRLLTLARGAIYAYLFEQRLPDSAAPLQPGERRGAFVTLHLAGRLRGCIGRTDSPDPIETLVKVCAVLAATRDPRFPPVQSHEIDALEIELSLLTPPGVVPAAEVLSRLEIGVHGVAVSLGGLRGLLLPQVGSEQGWTAQRFLEETCRKAGLPAHAWRESETRIELFTAEVFSEAEFPAAATGWKSLRRK